MTLPFRCAIVLAAVVAAGPAVAGPDLSCSSEGIKGTVEQIIGGIILKGVPADRAAKIRLSGDITAIRTVSATDTKHLCEAALDAHAAYDGPMVVVRDADQYTAWIRAAIDTVMGAAAFSDAERTAVHQGDVYRAPTAWSKSEQGVTMAGESHSRYKEQGGAIVNASTRVSAVEAALNQSITGPRSNAIWATKEFQDRFRELRDADREAATAEDAINQGRFDAEAADKIANGLSGEITYSVEATDDGQAYIRVLSAGNN
jgi:hypothetical protein